MIVHNMLFYKNVLALSYLIVCYLSQRGHCALFLAIPQKILMKSLKNKKIAYKCDILA